MKLGLDIYADTIVVVRILENSAPQPAQKFLPEKFLASVKTQLAQAEASRNRARNHGRTVATTIDLGSRQRRATARVCSRVIAS